MILAISVTGTLNLPHISPEFHIPRIFVIVHVKIASYRIWTIIMAIIVIIIAKFFCFGFQFCIRI
jgi:hypothetical protein